MDPEKINVKFKKVSVLPGSPVPGTFYWFGEQVWFATATGLVLLSNEVGQDLLDRLSAIEERMDDIFGSEGIDLNLFVTREEVEEMLRDITPDVELDDSDYDIIAEKVNLTWQVI